MKITQLERMKLMSNFGFTDDLVNKAEKFITEVEKVKKNSYYSIGALMSILSARQLEKEIKVSHTPTGKIRKALNDRYGDKELIDRMEKDGYKNEWYFSHKPWMDHLRYVQVKNESKNKKTEKGLLTSPYGLSLEDLKDIVEFCEKYNLSGRVAGIEGETYFPGHAVDVWIWPITEKNKRRIINKKTI